MALVWEQIDNYHQRAKVFGGWLVKAYEDNYDENDEAEPIEDDLDIIAEMIELDSDDLKEE